MNKKTLVTKLTGKKTWKCKNKQKIHNAAEFKLLQWPQYHVPSLFYKLFSITLQINEQNTANETLIGIDRLRPMITTSHT